MTDYETGYQDALTLAAERVDELDAIWRPIVRPTYEELVADRICTMERYSEQVYAHLGRVGYTYTGGAVVWETGAPA